MPDSYTKLLMHMNVSPFVDVLGHVLTNMGNTVTLDTGNKVFGAGSAKFSGTSWSEGISTPSADDLQFGTGDLAIDFRVCGGDADTDAIYYVDNYNEGIMINRASNDLSVYSGSGTAILSCVWNPVINTWYHIAVTRASGTVRIFIDGIKKGEVECTRDITTTAVRKIGLFMTGRIDELRVSKGIARWTADFTPPTEEYNGVKRALPSFFRI